MAVGTDRTERRYIVHADLDAFYATVEQLDDPKLRGRPVLVGGRPEERGVVATAFYEAREYGVHSAMPMSVAVRLCPEGIIMPPRFDRYKQLSDKVMAIFRDLTDLVEPLSLDEAYLDITSVVNEDSQSLAMALDLKRRVLVETGLTLSVGVATCKSVAKIASDMHKPDCLLVVSPGDEQAFLAPLPVGKLFGIGPKTAEWLVREGIEKIGQLAAKPENWYVRRFGRRGANIREKALGKDRDVVRTERATKSISSEITFASDISNIERICDELSRLAGSVACRLESNELQGRTVTVKCRLSDFTTFTRQAKMSAPTSSGNDILEMAWRLIAPELMPGRAFRLLGVGLSHFGSVTQAQLPLFETAGTTEP